MTERFPRVVLISELEEFTQDLDIFSGRLEAMSKKAAEALMEAILSSGYDLIHYSNPKEFLDQITFHQTDLVLIAWNGETSTSRVGLLPSICEAAGIAYLGADAATRIVCNDKELSKVFARRIGFHTSNGLRLVDNKDLELIESLKYPVIVKPCQEGSSIGISSDSVCEDIVQARNQIRLLWKQGFKHVYIEEFVEGKEICICVMGGRDGPAYTNVIEVSLKDDPTYLFKKPYDARIKKGLDGTRKLALMNKDEFTTELDLARSAFLYFEKLNLMRIDGRLDKNGKFHFIEFATLPTFGLSSETYFAMSEYFPVYNDFISTLLSLELTETGDPDTSLRKE